MRAVQFFLFGFLSLFAGAVWADGIENEFPQQFEGVSGWSGLCEVTDCDQFPVGYHTYVFGSEVYYFPTGQTLAAKEDFFNRPVRRGGFVDLGEDGELVRSAGFSGSLIISRCCSSLLAFYDLLDQFPRFRPEFSRGRPASMPPGRTSIRSHDRPLVYQNQPGWGRRDDGEITPALKTYLASDQPSYNDDFWLTSIGEVDSEGRRGFSFLSKEPILLGRHVQGGCRTACSFATVAFAETASETRPHIVIQSVYTTDDNMFLCSPKEFKAGCNPASRTMDDVLTMILLLDDMFDAAQVFPEAQAQ